MNLQLPNVKNNKICKIAKNSYQNSFLSDPVTGPVWPRE